MSFAVVLEGMSLVSFFVVLSGGKRLRESGWKVLSLLILLSAVVQVGSVSLVVSLPFFFPWFLFPLLGVGFAYEANDTGISLRQRRQILCGVAAG